MADEFVCSMLKEYGLEKFILRFEESGVDEEVFRNLNDDMIDRLIPELGFNFKFKQRFKSSFIEIVVSDVPLDTSHSDDHSMCNTKNSMNHNFLNEGNEAEAGAEFDEERSPEVEIDVSQTAVSHPEIDELKNYLTDSYRGDIVLETFRQQRTVDRSVLSTVIIEREFKRNRSYDISAKRFKELALLITLIFSGECEDIWYVASARGANGPIGPTGILYRKYISMRQPLFDLGRIKKTVETAKNKNSTPTTATESKAIRDMIEWLKHSNEPQDTILDYWIKTYEHRSWYNTLSISEYLDTFKCLKLPQGYLLFESDFTKIAPKSVNNLLSKWPTVANNIINYAKENSNSWIKQFNKANPEFVKSGDKNIVALFLLPLLIGSINRKTKRSEEPWHPDTKEVQRTFIFHAETIEEIDDFIEEKTSLYAKHKESLQPFPVVLGPLNKIVCSYAVVNDVRYKFDSLLKALDVCYKLIFALNAKYPVECFHVWTFIQKHIYEMTIAKQPSYTKVSNLIIGLNRISKN